MSTAWTDKDDTETFWKHVNNMRDETCIARQELPHRLQDAASDNPDLFVRLVDQMVRVYEEKVSTVSRKSTIETDESSHCPSVSSRCVVSYNPSMEEVEVSFDPSTMREIAIYDSQNAEHEEIEPLSAQDNIDDNASLAKSIITFTPEAETVEVTHRSVESDDNASQVSNLSYATEVASMIRELRDRIAGNNSLATGMTRELDEASLHWTKKEASKKEHFQKKQSRSPSLLQKEVNTQLGDHRDDVSLLSENEFSMPLKAETAQESPVKSKGRKGMFRRFMNKSKKMNPLKTRKGKSVRPSHSDVSEATAQDVDTVTYPVVDAEESTRDDQQRESWYCSVEPVDEARHDVEEARHKREPDEIRSPTAPLPITIAPYATTSMVHTNDDDGRDARNMDIVPYSPGEETSHVNSPCHDSYTLSTSVNHESHEWQSVRMEAGKHRASTGGEKNFVEADENSEYNESNRVSLGQEDDESDLQLVSTAKLDASAESDDETDDEIVAIFCKDDERCHGTKKEIKILGNNRGCGNQIDPGQQPKHGIRKDVEEFFGTQEEEPIRREKKNPPGQSPVRTPQSRFLSRSPTRKQGQSSKSPRASSKSPTQRYPVARASPKKIVKPGPGENVELWREPLLDRRQDDEGSISDGDNVLLSVLGTFDKSIGTTTTDRTNRIVELIDSDEEKSVDDPYVAHSMRVNKKPALHKKGAQKPRVSKWFRKEFMEGSEPTPSRSIDYSISDGYSQEDSFGSYSTTTSGEWSAGEENPAAALLLDAVQGMFDVLSPQSKSCE